MGSLSNETPGTGAPSAPAGGRGFTLMELMVTLVLITALMGAAVYSAGFIAQADFKNEVRRLSSAINYTWSRAAVNNAQYRIIFDLDDNSYRTEVTQASVVSSPEESEDESSEFVSEEAQRAQEREEESATGEDSEQGDPFNVGGESSYEEVKASELKPHKLPGTIRIVHIIPCDREGRIEEGNAALHFYPNGFIQPAIIVLQQGQEGRYFSLKTEPLTGQIEISSENLEETESCGQPEEIQEDS